MLEEKTLDKHCPLCFSVYEGNWNGPYIGQLQDLLSLGFYQRGSKRNFTSGQPCNRTPECRQYNEELRLQLEEMGA